MATEGPLIRDGAQCVAAANYFNPGVALAGPGGSGQFLAVALSSSVDRTVVLTTAAGQVVYGILQNTPPLGIAADVAIFGVTKAVANAAITRGAKLQCDTNGGVITWATAGHYALGYALESATVQFQVITILLFPSLAQAT